jgi:hypothetical protein
VIISEIFKNRLKDKNIVIITEQFAQQEQIIGE